MRLLIDNGEKVINTHGQLGNGDVWDRLVIDNGEKVIHMDNYRAKSRVFLQPNNGHFPSQNKAQNSPI